MALNFSTVSNQISNAIAWTVAQANVAARRIVQVSSNSCPNVCQKLSTLIAKVRAVDVSTMVQGVKTFAKSDLGIGFGLIAIAVTSIAACDRPVQLTAKTCILTACACLCVTASACVVFKPAALGLIRV